MLDCQKTCIFVFTYLFLIIANITYANNINRDNFSGKWCWDLNSNISVFSIVIDKKSENNIGGYFCVSQSGNKIDDNEAAFSFKTTRKKTVITNLKSGISGNIGILRLEVLNKNKLKWVIIKRPKGEMYVPNEAILNRCSF